MQQAPTYIEENLDLLQYRERCYHIHTHKKNTIRPTMNAPETVLKVAQQQQYVKILKQQNKTFNTNEKNILLNRDNQILLNKLVDISQGKASSVNGPAVYKSKRASQSVGPRSLNINVRKRENDRIERENHAFAKRLFQNGGNISKKQHDQQHEEQMRLKMRIQRANKKLPGIGGHRNTQLPPLDQSAFSRSKRSAFSVPKNDLRSSSQVKFNTQNAGGAFAGKLNADDSAGVIPINSMYEKGEDELNEATDGQDLRGNGAGQKSKSPAASKGKVKKNVPGTLTLTIGTANLTRDVDLIGKQDPFVELNLYTQFWSWKSEVIESGGKTPTWNQTTEIPIKNQNQDMTIKIMDQDLAGNAELVAQTEIVVSDLCVDQGFEDYVPVNYKGTDAGKLQLRASFKEDDPAQAANIGAAESGTTQIKKQNTKSEKSSPPQKMSTKTEKSLQKSSPQKMSTKSPERALTQKTVKMDTGSEQVKSDAQLKGVPTENMPPADYKPEEDKQNIEDGQSQEKIAAGAATPGKQSQASVSEIPANDKPKTPTADQEQ